MRSNNFKSVLKHAGLVASVLLLASGAAFAQQQVNLTAGAATAILPDGTAVPMWGYSCGAAAGGSTATCGALNPQEPTGSWAPGGVPVPTGQSGYIKLTNTLS